jgi:hypothetical protein
MTQTVTQQRKSRAPSFRKRTSIGRERITPVKLCDSTSST